MAVFRVQKTQNYTIMSNHHLRNKALSLKAKGLLSLMLSLPEDWDYTTRGLASICKEGVDSVCATVRELEAAGYIIRRRMPSEQNARPIAAKKGSPPRREERTLGGFGCCRCPSCGGRHWRWLAVGSRA